MKTEEDIRRSVAETLAALRVKKGLSKAAIANELYISEKTWSRYESGESAPTVPEFLQIFNQLGENALTSCLKIVYPTTYGALSSDSSDADLRQAAAKYFLEVASMRTVREWAFLIDGHHGSNIEAQMQEFTAIDHLPLVYRVAVAEMVDTCYRLAEARGELIATDHVMPDMQIYRDAIEKGKAAAYRFDPGYTTAII